MLTTSLVFKTVATLIQTKIPNHTSTMTTNHLRAVFEPTLETLRTSIPYHGILHLTHWTMCKTTFA